MRYLSLLLTAFLLFLFPAAAHAQTSYDPQTLFGFSETEKVGFAFYQLINKDPPYEDWVQARSDYIKAIPSARLRIMDADRIRLRDGFAAFLRDRDLIKITTTIMVSVSDNPDLPNDDEAKRKNLTKRITLVLKDAQLERYFPFQLGKMWIGVIPMDLDKFSQIDMNNEDYRAFCKALFNCRNFEKIALQAQITLKPVLADDKKPMMDGDIPVFLMMSEVASVSILFTGSLAGTRIVWTKNAPWYMNRQTQELMTLHK